MSRKRSFLLSGIGVIVVNAFIQCLLVIPSPVPHEQGVMFALLALVSTLVYFGYLTFIVAISTAPKSVTTPRGALAALRPQLGRFALWLIGFSVVFTIGLFLYFIPGFIILAIGPMVVLAAADAQSNPLKANFAAIGHHFGGWLWRILVSGLIALVCWLSAGLFMFLWVGAVGAFAAWIVVGIGTWILTKMWVHQLRRSPSYESRTPADESPDPAPEAISATSGG